MVEVPLRLEQHTVEREGKAGAAWLAALPRIVDELMTRWDCAPDGEAMHGGVGLVVPVRRTGGRAVIKVSFPHPGNVHEPDAFAAWRGQGAVLLYERDDAHYAMLLERAHTTTLVEETTDEAAAIAGQLNRRLAIPAPASLPRLEERADAWEEQLLKDAAELAHAIPQQVVDAAAATIRELGRAQPGLVIHGDLHARNILRADREPWLAIDPKGLVGDPAYDAGTMFKSLALRLLETDDLPTALRRAMGIFTESAELDHERVRRWTQLHAVQAAFWGRRHGFRRARSGPGLGRLIAYADHLAALV